MPQTKVCNIMCIHSMESIGSLESIEEALWWPWAETEGAVRRGRERREMRAVEGGKRKEVDMVGGRLGSVCSASGVVEGWGGAFNR